MAGGIEAQPVWQRVAVSQAGAVTQVVAHIWVAEGAGRYGETECGILAGRLISQWDADHRRGVQVYHLNNCDAGGGREVVEGQGGGHGVLQGNDGPPTVATCRRTVLVPLQQGIGTLLHQAQITQRRVEGVAAAVAAAAGQQLIDAEDVASATGGEVAGNQLSLKSGSQEIVVTPSPTADSGNGAAVELINVNRVIACACVQAVAGDQARGVSFAQGVIAVSSLQHIATGPTLQIVITTAANQRVVALLAGEEAAIRVIARQ
ncbi:hypothetical protein D3C75_742600 [compost metagenome]